MPSGAGKFHGGPLQYLDESLCVLARSSVLLEAGGARTIDARRHKHTRKDEHNSVWSLRERWLAKSACREMSKHGLARVKWVGRMRSLTSKLTVATPIPRSRTFILVSTASAMASPANRLNVFNIPGHAKRTHTSASVTTGSASKSNASICFGRARGRAATSRPTAATMCWSFSKAPLFFRCAFLNQLLSWVFVGSQASEQPPANSATRKFLAVHPPAAKKAASRSCCFWLKTFPDADGSSPCFACSPEHWITKVPGVYKVLASM